MRQEIGETRDALISDANKQIEDILNANKNRSEPYYIVMFVKPAKGHVQGKPALYQYFKAYKEKPAPKVGMIVGEVNPTSGTIDWDVNMPQAPINYDGILLAGGQESNEIVTETTSIPGAYVTQ